MLETAEVFAQAANHTVQALFIGAVEGVRGKASGPAMNEWVKGLLGKKEWRIQCLDILIRV